MGVYDIFTGPPDENGVQTAVQVKMTNDGRSLPYYTIGDTIELPDCVIIGYEGFVVIKDNTVILVDETVYDKWGGLLECKDITEERNVIAQVLHTKSKLFEDGKKAQEVLRNTTDLESPSDDEIEEVLDNAE